MHSIKHQYIERATGSVRTERLYQDRVVLFFYGTVREHMPAVFRLLTNARTTRLLGYLNYDTRWGSGAARKFLRNHGVDLVECLDDPAGYDTPRKVFERRIRYWECRPLPTDARMVVAPADSRVLVGSFLEHSGLYLKDKFFAFEELLGHDKGEWRRAFAGGDYAVFRLTPEKYHYNHTPVAGVVRDCYALDGDFHSCNPGATMLVAQPYSKNRRVVTVIDTDIPGGTGVGLVAMIEVVALMIGEIVQCYSEVGYRDPVPVIPGMFVQRGYPKSLFRPGSSTTVLLFQPGRIQFAGDLVENRRRPDASSRYVARFSVPLVETDVTVRSAVAHRV